MIIPFSAGAIATRLASFASAFLIFTYSPTPAPAFLLVIPSILIKLRPISAGYARIAIAPVFRVPSISTISPSLIPSFFMVLDSILTIPLPASSLAVNSPTFNLTSFSFFGFLSNI